LRILGCDAFIGLTSAKIFSSEITSKEFLSWASPIFNFGEHGGLELGAITPTPEIDS
jgi:hypothetical protein